MAEYRLRLEGFEGRIAWPYLDGPGNVTAACGHLCATLEDFLKLPWEGENPEYGYAAIKSAQPGMLASHYSDLTTCRLSQDSIDSIRDADIEAKLADLSAALPECSSWPPSVRVSLLDMSFNLGCHGLAHGYPKMLTAMRIGDWKTAAAESHRNGIQQSRNDYAASLILSAQEIA